MSPFVQDLPSKHRRRGASPPHPLHPGSVEGIQVLHKRVDSPPSSTETFNDILNKWWAAFAIAGLVSVVLLVIAVISLARYCTRRWKPRQVVSTKQKQTMKEKATGNSVKPITVHLRMRPERLAPDLDANLRPPPNIMITPATASPSQLKFGHRANLDPDLGLGANEYGYRRSLDSLANVKQDHVGRVQTHVHDLTRQLSFYRDQDFTRDHAGYDEDEKLDEIDLRSPRESTEHTEPDAATATAVTSLANHVSAMVAKRFAQTPPSPSEESTYSDSESDATFNGGERENYLTDGELHTLAHRFPLPAYSRAVPFKLEEERFDEGQRSVARVAFHRPSRYMASPRPFIRHANEETVSPPPTTDQHSRSWSPPTSPVESRLSFSGSGTVPHTEGSHSISEHGSGIFSDRYAIRHFATATATERRRPDVGSATGG